MDNASNNDTFLESLAALYGNDPSSGVSLDPVESRIMCFPHIINICTQHVIKAISQNPDLLIQLESGSDDEDEDSDDDMPPLIDYDGDEDDEDEEVILGDDGVEDPNSEDEAEISKAPPNLVDKIRALVRAMRSSRQRQDALSRVIEAGNKLQWWYENLEARKGAGMPITSKKFLLDVKTRWDSTYLMLVRLLEMRQPLDKFFATDAQGTKIQHLQLDKSEWSRTLVLVGLLQYPHGVQQVMSKEKTPVLSGAIPSLERFMQSWEKLKESQKNLAPAIDIGLKYAYKYYERMDKTSAYVVALFLHPGVRMSWVREYWDPEWSKDAEKKIKELMKQYKKSTPPTAPAATAPSRTQEGYINIGLPSHFMHDEDLSWIQPRSSTQVETVEEEFHRYASGMRSSMEVSILKFWESHRDEFPTLHAIAMDYLSIQASAVPCERAFSSSAETDTLRRNRINPILMEALQMLKFAFRNDRLDFSTGLLATEEDLAAPRNVIRRDGPALLASLINAKTQGEKEDSLDRVIRATRSR